MRTILLTLFMAVVSTAFERHGASLDSLRAVLGQRSRYVDLKQRDLRKLKTQLHNADTPQEELLILNSICREYSTFQFDSAMVYVGKMADIAERNNARDYMERASIHKAFLLTTSGLFHEAIQTLDNVNRKNLPQSLLNDYFTAYEWAYGMLAEYSARSEYSDGYYEKEKAYQDSIISVLKPQSSECYYWQAEKAYRAEKFNDAKSLYLRSLKDTPKNERRYAQVAFGLALTELSLGDSSAYRNWLIEAAISDQICPLKENLAIQELALELSNDSNPDLETANDFLHVALEDAMFYGNRLRLIEVSRKIPDIVRSYEIQLQRSNRNKSIVIYCMTAFALLLVIAAFVVTREHRKLTASRKGLQQANEELKNANARIKSTNTKLEATIAEVKNQKLVTENCITLFMELTAAYINKLNVFQATVQRKIKANQVEELRRYSNPSRMTDAEAKEFFINFDQAFLKAFPGFIDKFNALLAENKRIVLNEGELMNIDLRIFALIRLGIKDSSKIAVLLNYSPQTIYNHRSTIKGYAINKDTFESDVIHLN